MLWQMHKTKLLDVGHIFTVNEVFTLTYRRKVPYVGPEIIIHFINTYYVNLNLNIFFLFFHRAF